jgi:ABC-2 type transport system permease protein
MNPRRLWAIARKEFLHVLRDPRSLLMALAIPMLLLLLFGYALTLDVDNVPMIVWDQSATPASRDFISRFDGSPYFGVVRYAANYADVIRAIDEGRVRLALIVPSDFAGRVASGRGAAAQVIIDGSDANTATIVRSYVDAVAEDSSRRIVMELLRRRTGRVLDTPLDLRLRVWFNADMQSRNYIIPGLIVMVMMIIAALLTSLTVAREWERGTMEQLISTPVKTNELILGKLIPYFVIGMVDVTLAVLMGEFLFHVPLRGNAALVFAVTAVFLAGALSLGILISITTKSQLLANQLAMIVTYLPAFLLSGLMFSISNMPKPLQTITYAVPARYAMKLLRDIYLKGLGPRALAVEGAFLALFALVVLAVANLKFRKRLE